MHRFSIVVFTTIGCAVLACQDDGSSTSLVLARDGGADVAPGPNGDGDATAPRDAATDALDPARYSDKEYSRDCETDEDCVLIDVIHDCSTCCGEMSVRRGVETEHAAVLEACRQRGVFWICGMACGEGRAACFERICVRLPLDGGS